MESYRRDTIKLEEEEKILSIKILPDKIFIVTNWSVKEIARINYKEVLVSIDYKEEV